MKLCKTLIIVVMLVLSTFAIQASAETKIQATDKLGDVVLGEEVNESIVPYPEIDIKDILVDRVGKKINLKLTINESGTFLDSGQFLYLVYLTTTSNVYSASYGTKLFLSLFGYGGYADLQNESFGEIAALVFTEDNMDIDLLDSYETQDNELTFNFDLEDSNEICVGVQATIMYLPSINSNFAYLDELNLDFTNDFLSIDAGGPYYTETGQNFDLSGTINKTASDYEWAWTFEGSTQTKIGQSITHRFLKPGDFTGTLFVYNPDNGKHSSTSFTVTVNGTAVNGGNGENNQPGFEIIAFISAIAIALIILRRRKYKK